MTAYYNEFDPFAAAWLRELIKAGLIAPGDVDERSIADVRPEDLTGYTQCHFFAGIGGWSYALRLAGWDDARPVWTGSCPCQPFSAAGKQQGTKDDRHLWPEFFRLIRECRPDTVFGEQVANAIGHDWLDHVSSDLEGEGYAVGSIVLGAHSVGAPHIRQRLWFVGESERRPAERRGYDLAAAPCGTQGEALEREWIRNDTGTGCDVVELGNADGSYATRLGQVGIPLEPEQEAIRPSESNPWEVVEFIGCADGKSRPTQPGLFPLAHGVSARVGRLRGYGNAIVPQTAAEVIRAYMEH